MNRRGEPTRVRSAAAGPGGRRFTRKAGFQFANDVSARSTTIISVRPFGGGVLSSRCSWSAVNSDGLEESMSRLLPLSTWRSYSPGIAWYRRPAVQVVRSDSGAGIGGYIWRLASVCGEPSVGTVRSAGSAGAASVSICGSATLCAREIAREALARRLSPSDWLSLTEAASKGRAPGSPAVRATGEGESFGPLAVDLGGSFVDFTGGAYWSYTFWNGRPREWPEKSRDESRLCRPGGPRHFRLGRRLLLRAGGWRGFPGRWRRCDG